MNIDRIENGQLDLLLAGKGRKRKEKALQEHDEHKQSAIVWLRKQLAELYRWRTGAFPATNWPVSADDARAIYDASSFPAKYSANRTFFGSIFRGKEWEVVSRTQSKHPANNAREIKTWRYVGD